MILCGTVVLLLLGFFAYLARIALMIFTSTYMHHAIPHSYTHTKPLSHSHAHSYCQYKTNINQMCSEFNPPRSAGRVQSCKNVEQFLSNFWWFLFLWMYMAVYIQYTNTPNTQCSSDHYTALCSICPKCFNGNRKNATTQFIAFDFFIKTLGTPASACAVGQFLMVKDGWH